MIHVSVCFHEALDFFISRGHESRSLEAEFHVTRSVKDLIESIGVPHVEVDCILVNGVSVRFDYLLADGDSVKVFPPGISSIPSEKENLLHLVPPDPQPVRFIADVHLKTLTRHLRMLGFDTLYDRSWDDDILAELSEQQERVLLSRDTRLLMRSNVTRGLYIRSTHPRTQIVEVINRYDLSRRIDPFKRCISCNGEITTVKREEIDTESVPAGVLNRAGSIFRCKACGKYYWNGTHVEKMQEKIDDIRRRLG